MPPGLTTLLRLRARAGLRRMTHNLRTPRGAIFFIISVGVLLLFLGPNLFVALSSSRTGPDLVQTFFPITMLILCAVTLFLQGDEKAIPFSPAEVNFLFAGPFTRRQLLLYRLSTVLTTTGLTSLFLSVMLLRHAATWLGCVAGLFFAMLFVHLFAMTLVLVGQRLGQRAFTRARQLLLVIMAALILLGAYLLGAQALSLGIFQAVTAFRESWPGRILLAPFAVFAHMLTSTSLPGLLGWIAAGALINVTLAWLLLELDVNFLEGAARQAEALWEKQQRRQGVDAAAWGPDRIKARARLPQLPRLGGAGPIIWRQLTTASRNSRALLFCLLVLVAMTLPGAAGGFQQDRHWVVLPALVISLFLTARLTFDFRGDLEHMDSLKALPASPVAIVLGQLATPVLLITALQWLTLAGLAFMLGDQLLALSTIGMFLPAINFVVLAADNLLFLLFPARQVPNGPGDFQFLGRAMLLAFAKFVMFGICAGVAGFVGFCCYILFGRALVPAILAAWVMLTGVGAALVPALVAAFRRYDVSVDTPAS